jgi:non-ribosomal peptide synthetase component E (peptide arylation enzyme)
MEVDVVSRLRGFGAKVAVVEDNRELTYEQLAVQVHAMREGYLTAGVSSGSVAGLDIGGEVDHLIAALALMASGA